MLVLVVGCGGGHGVGGDDGGMGDGGTSTGSGVGGGGDNGNGSGSDGGSDNGSGSGNGNGNGSGTGSDGTVETNCARPIAPTVTTTVTGSVPNIGAFNHNNNFAVFRAGDQILAASTVDPAHYWLRWTPGGWTSELIPWPANMPTGHNHYINFVFQLATTRALIVSDDYFVMTYDGHAMSSAVALPTGHPIWGYTQDTAGAYHVFSGTSEYMSKPDGTWYPPAPVPIPITSGLDDIQGAAAVMRDGRLVVIYLDDKFDAPAQHAHVISYAPNGPWTADQDITTNWRSNAEYPAAYAPPGGGIVLEVNLGMWRSADGMAFGNYENMSYQAIAGECLDSLVLSGGSAGLDDMPGNWSLYELQGTSWVTFAGDTIPAYEYDVSGVATLPSGKTFWVVSSHLGKTDYLVSP